MVTRSANYCTTRTQKTIDAKIRLATCAVHTKTAVNANFFVTFVAMLSASFADQSTVITMVTRSANYSATRTQQTFYAKISLAACAFHANTAVFAYLFVTFVAMLSALFANQSAVFTMVTRGANYCAIRTQITRIAKIFFATGAINAHAAVNAKFIGTYRATLVAFRTEFGASFAGFAAS